VIGVCARPGDTACDGTLQELGRALGVSFEHRSLGDDRNVDGWLVLGADRQLVSAVSRTTRPCYVVLPDAGLMLRESSGTIAFTNRPELPAVLRNRTITAEDAVDADTLPPWLDDVEPLALKDGAAVWAVQTRAAARHHYVSLPLPALKAGEALFTHLSGPRLARLLPFVLFLQSVGDRAAWEPPPLQATFMFDDPNLHWPSYGFIDYREMVGRAAAGQYHVSVATIPLDAWFVHRRARAIFLENPGRLSLLYHGNDHIFRELGPSRSTEAMQRLFGQAVARISTMEGRTGLEVARVMAPPHGACSEAALAEMARRGFEAACVSRGSLRHHNPEAPWTRTIGLNPCDIVAGLPVIPRFGLSQNCRNDILIAAALRQPIVPITHHQAVAEGYGLLDEIAAFVNSLGAVAWTDMKTISRSLYSRRQDAETLRVRMWSRRVSLRVPPGITRIQFDGAAQGGGAGDELFWRIVSGDRSWRHLPGAEPLAVATGDTVEIASRPDRASELQPRGAGTRLVPLARRLLTETRDRMLPALHRIPRRRTAAGPA
jgi:hypothetical protein